MVSFKQHCLHIKFLVEAKKPLSSKDRNLLLPGAIIAIFCYGCQSNIYPPATLNYIICHEHGLGSLFETTKDRSYYPNPQRREIDPGFWT